MSQSSSRQLLATFIFQVDTSVVPSIAGQVGSGVGIGIQVVVSEPWTASVPRSGYMGQQRAHSTRDSRSPRSAPVPHPCDTACSVRGRRAEDTFYRRPAAAALRSSSRDVRPSWLSAGQKGGCCLLCSSDAFSPPKLRQRSVHSPPVSTAAREDWSHSTDSDSTCMRSSTQ